MLHIYLHIHVKYQLYISILHSHAILIDADFAYQELVWICGRTYLDNKGFAAI